jgi:glycosyltransferase involved in cell wall biosynthesis
MIESARVQFPVGIEREFVVVDGGSTDGTLAWCKEQDDIKLIEHGELLGVQKAFCDGAFASTGDYVVLANDDIQFLDNGIIQAMIYLEDNRSCGGVAFEDDRSNRGDNSDIYGVQGMPAHGAQKWVVYAQVGMYPRDIGDEAGWWGIDDEALPPITYGVDNYLSARIWEMGLSIDRVPGVKVHDLIVRDELRERMTANDSNGYFKRYPNGPFIPALPATRDDNAHLRVLYLPLYEPGHPIQLEQKTGLRDALRDYGRGQWIWEFNYMYSKSPYQSLCNILDLFKPNMVMTQFHDTDRIAPEQIRMARAHAPKSVWINWNGDYWPKSLVSDNMLHLLRQFDLQLVVNDSVRKTYTDTAIQSAYWQIGYEDPPVKADFKPEPVDVVWLATVYNEPRKQVDARLQQFDYAQYGPDSEPSTLYNFTNAKALYRSAKIAIGTNEYPDADGFVSNRLFQAIAAGNCLLIHQNVPRLDELIGIEEGKHYVGFDSLDEMVAKIKYYLAHDVERKRIANRGTRHIRQHHSFTARVAQLFQPKTGLVHLTQRPPATYFGVRYHGKNQKPFGEFTGGRHYSIVPGRVCQIEPEHTAYFARQPELYEICYPQEP